MDKTKTLLITILAILMFGIPVVLGKSSTHVLVIYSTSEDSPRATEINRGMEIYLASHTSFANTVLFDRYYLNMENPSRQKCVIFLTEMSKLQGIIEDKKPDLVILSGNITQRLIGVRLINPLPSKDILKKNISQLALDGKCNTDPNMSSELDNLMSTPVKYQPKIVFMGVTSPDAKEFGYNNQPEITGIYQRLYIPAIKETIEDLYDNTPEEPNGKPTNIMLIYDDASTKAPPDIQELKTELSRKNAFKVPLKWGGYFGVSAWDKWQDTIRSANKNNAMVLIAGYDNVGDQPARSVIRWTEDCAKFPVLGATASFIDDGGMLTITISDQEQGDSALELTDQLLADSQAEKIPYLYPNQFTIGLNQSLLDKRQINLPAMYASFSRLSNTFKAEPYQYTNPSGCNN